MNITIQSILNFSTFYEIMRTQKLPIKIAYKLSQLNKAITSELEFYREKFQEIVWNYGEIDENGQLVPTEDGAGIKIKPGTESECYSAIQELQDLEITLPDIKFTLEDFSNIELTMTEIEPILPFIEE